MRKTEAGWEASIAGPASLMNLETAQRAAEDTASAVLGREVSNIAWKPHELKAIVLRRDTEMDSS